MERDANKTGSHKTVTTIVLVVVVLLVVHFGRMLKTYYDGPSVEEALNSPFMRFERECRNTTYTFLYEDRDEAGRVRYHFVSNSGGNIPLVITCKFRWFDSWGFLEFYPAGWNYVCSNPEEWVRAYNAWGSGQEYGIPIR